MIKRFDECDRMSQIIVFDKYFKTAVRGILKRTCNYP